MATIRASRVFVFVVLSAMMLDFVYAKSAIVIGAGMSGISAAQALKAKGWQVRVLEARNRIGGRMWTARPFGYPMEFGGKSLIQCLSKLVRFVLSDVLKYCCEIWTEKSNTFSRSLFQSFCSQLLGFMYADSILLKLADSNWPFTCLTFELLQTSLTWSL
jgi:choline dehydrogenase-like flavoprotein